MENKQSKQEQQQQLNSFLYDFTSVVDYRFFQLSARGTYDLFRLKLRGEKL